MKPNILSRIKFTLFGLIDFKIHDKKKKKIIISPYVVYYNNLQNMEKNNVLMIDII